MRKLFLFSLMVLASMNLAAQHIYSNAEISSTADVIGTSRYVSMGGAMGALGADISAISSNPAAIGLFRRSDISLTAGLLWPKDKKFKEDNLTHGTFDQMGFVAAWNLDESKLKFINFAFNYQKKFNFANGFYADNNFLGGLSQVDQLANIANIYPNEYNLLGTAYNAYVLDKDELGYYNSYSADVNRYSHYSTGSTQAFDLNVSFNVNDRYYIGATFGIDNVKYDRYSMYTEERNNLNPDAYLGQIMDYELYNDQSIDGYGINFKVGTIIRPFEDDPFRIGLAIETPTGYRLKTKTLHQINSKFDSEGNYIDNGYYPHYGNDDSYLEYIVRTPWRARLSLGSTIDKYFAWDIEYEYANYAKNRMKYPDDFDYYESSNFAGITDKAMNQLNREMLRGQHTAKLGVEIKPADAWAIRFGYNYISSIFKKNAFLDQTRPSDAFDYITSTNFMNLSYANVLACGLGYRYKRFYVDMTYKFRQQNGKFYAFDDSFSSDAQFVKDNPTLANMKLDPVEVNLNRHTITWTMGFKF